MHVGENIKKYRNELDLTQKQLAEKSSLSESAIKYYESNRRNPKIETLTKIAIVLGVEIDDLIKGTEIINFNTADEYTRDIYLGFLAHSPNLKPLAEMIMKCGYTLYRESNTDITIYENNKPIATVPEKEFTDIGEDILKYIQKISEREVKRIITVYSIY